MALDNYKDQSTSPSAINAGFQFEFSCAHCGKKWQSPFKPYRMGQLTGFLSRFAFLMSGMSTAARATGGATDYNSRESKEKALAEAQAQAAQRYTRCGECRATVCNDCFDTDRDMCLRCVAAEAGTLSKTSAVAGGGGHACPNCNTASSGGRFCAECGFDMASTHKSCPGCGVLAERQARFCGDCGHGF